VSIAEENLAIWCIGLAWKPSEYTSSGMLSYEVQRRGVSTFFLFGSEWADALLQTSKHLPLPKPSWEHLFFALLWVTYRHESFHWHVETFALAHEVFIRQPLYRSYVEQVRFPISRENAQEWWEEALARLSC
jgi:hypothetical protein